MMRILYVINSFGPGGAEKLLVNFLKEFTKKQHVAFTVVQLCNTNTVDAYVDELRASGIEIITLGKSVYSPNILLKLRKIIVSGGYEVVHAHLFPSLYWVALLKLLFKVKTKLVFTEHSTANGRLGNVFSSRRTFDLFAL
ncbi:glycosyltransferase [Chitinophaga sedimenti]|uniref:glycosyltransferase n=1 Tax=Chitinophaga sedimenti TaxID=2033606 RepID=UPI00249ED36E|nr:glycosyltransferase [Chitinophaga sedimenti]